MDGPFVILLEQDSADEPGDGRLSPGVRQKRVIQDLKQLDGIVFAARIMVEPSSDPQYKDTNKLANVVLPGEPAYAAIMRGETVAADPINARPRKAPAASAQAPGWNAPAASSDKPWAGQTAPTGAAPAASASAPAGPAWLNG